jgi:hypothetical protein
MRNDRIQLRCDAKIRKDWGYSLLELIMVMLIFMIVIMITASAFEKIVNSSSQLSKSAESNIEGIIGLEIMRTDLEHAGFGLPYSMPFVAAFEESQVAADTLANGIDPGNFNDNKILTTVDPNKVPLAIQSAKAIGGTAGAWELGRDYIVIKSTISGMNAAAGKWSYVEGSGATSTIKLWGNNDLAVGDRVISLNASTRALIGTDTSNFSYQVAGPPQAPTLAYQPPNSNTNYLVYGVSSNVNLRVPYNRVDYYIKRPDDISPRCAKGTGTLYKAVMSQNGGGVTQYPLFDCVADMQVVYSLDANPDDGINEVNFHGDENYFLNQSAEAIRKQLKEVHVFILAHEGKKDMTYSYPTKQVQVGETLNGTLYGRQYDLSLLDSIGSEWANYRWKLYKIVVSPRNL